MKPSSTTTSRAFATLLAATFGAALSSASPSFTGPEEIAQLTAPPRDETSGIAASRHATDLLWAHDDSGGDAALFAVGTDGRARGRLQIAGGVKNVDWEDIATVELDGRSWLVIGDTGDNDAKRRSIALHFVPEPAPAELSVADKLTGRSSATLRLTYEDGPRDSESLAIDRVERAVYLLTKRDSVPRLYRATLPAAPLKDSELKLSFAGLVPRLPKPNAFQAFMKGHLGKQRARPCAMDFAADGSAAVVLTYGDVLIFPRHDREPWAEALAREPIVLAQHDLPQAEAVCFSKDGRAVYVASESTRSLLRYEKK